LRHQGYPPHPANNKLRDVPEILANNGHLFSFNKEILGSFDICGSCEAHALLWNYRKSYNIEVGSDESSIIGKAISKGGNEYKEMMSFSLRKLLKLHPNATQNDVNFMKCPSLVHFMLMENAP
jgi:hypothetical protein